MIDDDLALRARARQEHERREQFSHMETYIPIATRGQHVVIKRFAPLYAELDAFQAGKQIHLLLSAAPRSTKTSTIFHAAVRKMTRAKLKYAYGTYNVQAAREKSADCRDMAARAGLWVSPEKDYVDPEARFARAASTVFWQTARGGEAKFTGRGSGAIGSGFGLIHIGDPVKNDEEAESDTIADVNWSWMTGTMFTRRDPGGSIVVEHHRWSEDDPIGRILGTQRRGWANLSTEAQELLESVKWKYLDFPAVLGKGDPAVDELFVPEEDAVPGWRWFSRAELVFAQNANDVTWLSMYQQDPPRRGGKLFPDRYAEWEPAVDESGEPVGLIVNEEWFPVSSLEGKVLGLAVDSAGSEDSASDFTAVSLLAMWWEKVVGGYLFNADVLRVWFDRLESPDVVDYVAAIAKSEHLRGVPLGYEDQAEGRAQLRFLKRDHKELRVVAIKTDKSKRVRALSCAAGARKGRLRMPKRTPDNAEWLDETLHQLVNFTGKSKGPDGQKVHDDIVDSIVHGWNMGLKMARPSRGQVGGRAIGAHLPRGAATDLVTPGGIIIPGRGGLFGRR